MLQFHRKCHILPDYICEDGLHLSNSGEGEVLKKNLVSLNKNYLLRKPFYNKYWKRQKKKSLIVVKNNSE